MKYVKAVLNNNNVVNGEMVGLKDNVIIPRAKIPVKNNESRIRRYGFLLYQF